LDAEERDKGTRRNGDKGMGFVFHFFVFHGRRQMIRDKETRKKVSFFISLFSTIEDK
jgi:hypothetical protein